MQTDQQLRNRLEVKYREALPIPETSSFVMQTPSIEGVYRYMRDINSALEKSMSAAKEHATLGVQDFKVGQ